MLTFLPEHLILGLRIGRLGSKFVRVVFKSQLSVFALDLLLAGTFLDAQMFVVVSILRSRRRGDEAAGAGRRKQKEADAPQAADQEAISPDHHSRPVVSSLRVS